MIDRQFCHGTKILLLMFLSISFFTGCAPATSLTKAARDGNVLAIKNLLNNGSNINEPDSKQGWTPLYWAIYYDKPDAVQTLLDNGAMVNIQDADGNSPLMIAITHGNTIISKFLLEKGADANVRNKKQETPLLKAVNSADEEVVKMLVCKNADVEARDANGLNAINHAEYNQYTNTVQILYKAKYAKRRNSSTEISQMCSQRGRQEEKIEIVNLPPRLYTYSINLHNLRPMLTYNGNKSVAVVVQDQREYVLSRDNGPEYVGQTHKAFGVLYFSTLTGKKLYEEISHCISESLKLQGFKTVVIPIQLHNTSSEIMEKIKKANVERAIILKIEEWLFTTGFLSFRETHYENAEFMYALILTVLNESGQDIARNEVRGAEGLGSGPIYTGRIPFFTCSQKVQESAERLLQSLLNSSDIRMALQ